mmetsp:Transcript_28677/g.42474  ORF Transcript_28677/g.42474 Transcript_28677/m.42474 type:complete len:226 (-) Transcript_28677:975-1652(-)
MEQGSSVLHRQHAAGSHNRNNKQPMGHRPELQRQGPQNNGFPRIVPTSEPRQNLQRPIHGESEADQRHREELSRASPAHHHIHAIRTLPPCQRVEGGCRATHHHPAADGGVRPPVRDQGHTRVAGAGVDGGRTASPPRGAGGGQRALSHGPRHLSADGDRQARGMFGEGSGCESGAQAFGVHGGFRQSVPWAHEADHHSFPLPVGADDQDLFVLLGVHAPVRAVE